MLGGMSGFGSILIKGLNGGLKGDYFHAKTNETLTDVDIYDKQKLVATDKIGERASFTHERVFRIDGLPWDQKTMTKDTVTLKDGRVFEVTRADKSPLGITTCYVKLIQR
jgi:hypothetical protein